MQALTQPKSGSRYPSQAIARSKWRRIFCLLTAFNIVTVSGVLYLTYRVLTVCQEQELAAAAGTLIERLGAGIGFESQEGKGSRFYFTLPLEKARGKAGL